MPLYIAEYLADTGHLNTTQHGAYFLLIMHYWRMGGLPEDDRQLANITKLPQRIWLDVKPVIQDFFHDGWHHKRVDLELAKQEVIATKRAMAGQKGGNVTANARTIVKGLRQANARQMGQQTNQQMLGKGVAVTITKKESSPETESERVESPLASGEGQVEKPPSKISREAFDEMLARRKATA